MTTKTCNKCGKDKSLDEFYDHSGMCGGKLSLCKVCKRSQQTVYRGKNLDVIRAKDRKRGSRMTVDDVREYRKNNPDKYRAHNAANNALRDGKIFAPCICEGPGCESSGPFHKHHEDYSKTLEVDFYCPACHHSGNHK
jgi:hypothetical protein